MYICVETGARPDCCMCVTPLISGATIPLSKDDTMKLDAFRGHESLPSHTHTLLNRMFESNPYHTTSRGNAHTAINPDIKPDTARSTSRSRPVPTQSSSSSSSVRAMGQYSPISSPASIPTAAGKQREECRGTANNVLFQVDPRISPGSSFKTMDVVDIRRMTLREANRIHCRATRERMREKERLLREVIICKFPINEVTKIMVVVVVSS